MLCWQKKQKSVKYVTAKIDFRKTLFHNLKFTLKSLSLPSKLTDVERGFEKNERQIYEWPSYTCR